MNEGPYKNHAELMWGDERVLGDGAGPIGARGHPCVLTDVVWTRPPVNKAHVNVHALPRVRVCEHAEAKALGRKRERENAGDARRESLLSGLTESRRAKYEGT